MQEMVIYGVSFDMVGKQPIVLLKTVDGNRFLPIWIGHAEAAAIAADVKELQAAHALADQRSAELQRVPGIGQPAVPRA